MFSSEHNPSYMRKYFSNSHVAYVMHHLDDSLQLNEDSTKKMKWTLKNFDKHKLNNFLKYIRENGFPLHDHISDASSFKIPQDHVCFCSVIVKISDEVEVDSECLSIQYLGKSGSTTFEYVDHMLSAYEGVIFGRLSHKVTFSARSSDRISLVLFY